MKNLPILKLTPGKEKLARNRHPWVFSGALESSSKNLLGNWSPDGPWKDQPAVLEDHRGQFIAYGWVNPNSKICLRLVSWDSEVLPDEAWLLAQFRKSFELRRDLGLLGNTNTLAGRMVFSEGDGIPGVIVDRFAGYLVCQFENQGADARRAPILAALRQTALEFLPNLAGIVEYSTGDGRVLEGLEPRSGLLWGENPP